MHKRLQQLKPSAFDPAVILAFLRYLGFCISSGKALQVASALAYTTLLSLVPLIAVMFGFLGALPGFAGFEVLISDFIFTNFVPAFGETIDGYLGQFADRASQLTITGLMILLAIALMLMATIENAFNGIWRVSERRRPVLRFLVYWLLLTLGPIMIGIGLASTSYLLTTSAVDVVGLGSLKQQLLSVMPFLLSTVALTLLYILVPNCHVPVRYALLGGLIGALLFETAKYGFAWFVKTVPAYEAIYGTLAILPIFLIWIYLSWIVVLFGAVLSYALTTFQRHTRAEESQRDWDLVDVCLLLAALWQAQRDGRGLTLEQLAEAGPELPIQHWLSMLDELRTAQWVFEDESGYWLLLRDLSEQTLLDLHRLMPRKLPDEAASYSGRQQAEAALAPVFSAYREGMQQTLSVPVKPLLQTLLEAESQTAVE